MIAFLLRNIWNITARKKINNYKIPGRKAHRFTHGMEARLVFNELKTRSLKIIAAGKPGGLTYLLFLNRWPLIRLFLLPRL
ncbi:MAG TPA: hypothetical protein DCK87_06170 [Desulfotomaculum sp.]|nr:hypothetical protein [Desulfotomaculum sp.]